MQKGSFTTDANDDIDSIIPPCPVIIKRPIQMTIYDMIRTIIPDGIAPNHVTQRSQFVLLGLSDKPLCVSSNLVVGSNMLHRRHRISLHRLSHNHYI